MKLRNRSLAVLCVFAIAVLTACSASTDGGKPSAAADSSDPQAATLAYIQCLRDNGVTVADPNAEGQWYIESEGNSDETIEAADAACADLAAKLPAQEELSKEELQRMTADMQKYATCMRGKGYEHSDPVLGANGEVESNFNEVEEAVTDQDALNADARACWDEIDPEGANMKKVG